MFGRLHGYLMTEVKGEDGTCARRGGRDMNVRNEGIRRLPKAAAHPPYKPCCLVALFPRLVLGLQVVLKNFLYALRPNVWK